jgi:hypothetical protein
MSAFNDARLDLPPYLCQMSAPTNMPEAWNTNKIGLMFSLTRLKARRKKINLAAACGRG